MIYNGKIKRGKKGERKGVIGNKWNPLKGNRNIDNEKQRETKGEKGKIGYVEKERMEERLRKKRKYSLRETHKKKIEEK